MNVEFRRIVSAFSLVALVTVLFAAPANAATPTGVGTGGGGVTLVAVDYGDILKAAVLGESSSESIDPAVGTPSATETLSPLDVKSVTLPALDAASLPPVQTTSTGAADHKETALVDLSTLGVPGVGGTVNPTSLTSLVDADGASAALTSTLTDLNLISVLGLNSAALDLGGLAGPTASTATRGVSVDAITVLDLQAVLNLLGLGIGDLSLQQVTDLLQVLGEIPAVNSVLGTTSFASAGEIVTAVTNASAAVVTAQIAVDSAQATLDTATATLATTTTTLCGAIPTPLCLTLNAVVLGALQTAVTTAQGVLDTAQGALAVVQGLLDDVLNALVGVLGGTPLLQIDGVTAGAVATAADTVANSSAVVTAAINDIRVGGIDLGVIDANTALDQIDAVATTVMTTVNGALTTVDPSLANLLSVKLFQRATSVAQTGDYVQAVAGVSALEVTITPPDVCAVVNNVLAEVPILSLTQGLTLPASPVTAVLDQLGSIVPDCVQVLALASVQAPAIPQGAVAALTGPITLKAASVNSVADFKAVAATDTGRDVPGLPRTGVNETLLLVFGGLMAVAALGVRRVTAPAHARSRQR